jgi:hypothetical protein
MLLVTVTETGISSGQKEELDSLDMNIMCSIPVMDHLACDLGQVTSRYLDL